MQSPPHSQFIFGHKLCIIYFISFLTFPSILFNTVSKISDLLQTLIFQPQLCAYVSALTYVYFFRIYNIKCNTQNQKIHIMFFLGIPRSNIINLAYPAFSQPETHPILQIEFHLPKQFPVEYECPKQFDR